MQIKEIYYSGVKEFIKDLLEIDEYYYSKGKSNKEKSMDGRVRLGNNQSSILNQMIISIYLNDVSLLDLFILRGMTSHIRIQQLETLNGHPFSKSIVLDGLPDILRFVKESNTINTLIKADDPNLVNKLRPVGLYRMSVFIDFVGVDVLSLFNGFLENYVYTHFEQPSDIDDENKIKEMGGELVKNCYSSFLTKFHQEAHKSSLIEDFIIHRDFYTYMKKDYATPVNVELSKIGYPGGAIHFYGQKDATSLMTEVSMFRVMKNNDIAHISNTYLFMTGCLDFYSFLLLYSCVKGIDVIAYESFDILYSDDSFQFPLSKAIKSKYDIRINMMLAHHKECKNIVINDKSTDKYTSKTNLSHPSQRYGMILSGQLIRFVIKINMNELDQYKVLTNSLPSDQLVEFLRKSNALANSIRKQLFS